MLSIYLDSNVYITGLLYPETDSALILREVMKGGITVVQSDYLINEVIHWFKQKALKDWAGKARLFMITIPDRELFHSSEWSIYMPKWKDFIEDEDDIPHICSYFAGNCDFFVTANRKLTQMKIKGYVNFKSPEEFVTELSIHETKTS
jgi:predicted nucleic acid-binding protein